MTIAEISTGLGLHVVHENTVKMERLAQNRRHPIHRLLADTPWRSDLTDIERPDPKRRQGNEADEQPVSPQHLVPLQSRMPVVPLQSRMPVPARDAITTCPGSLVQSPSRPPPQQIPLPPLQHQLPPLIMHRALEPQDPGRPPAR